MQTFLPYASFERSAQVLDPVRRWKQCLEARQLVSALVQGPTCLYDVAEGRYVYGPTAPRPGHKLRVTPWYNHPACVMWRGRVAALRLYFNFMLVQVLKEKTHRVTAWGTFDLRTVEERNPPMPWWFGRPAFHRTHRSNLLRKDQDYYGAFGWAEPATLPYWWPGEIPESVK